MNPQLQWHLQRGERATPSRGAAPFDALAPRQIVETLPAVRVLVQGDPLKAAAAISLFGGKVLGYHGDTVHAEVSASQMRMLMQEQGIRVIEPSRKMQPSLDVSRTAIHADDIHAGVNLQQPYTGKGVIVGIVDTGIDITHPDFRNPDGSTRILAVWDQTYEYSDGTGKPAGFEYGVECTAEQINAANAGSVDACLTDDGKPIDDVPTEGHGTHVAGVAAGSDETYRGIAPDATLIVVRAHFEEGSILDAVDYVFSKCQELNRPCVVNLSLGTTAGAHDGTSLIEQKLAEKTGAGKFIVAAAGNEAVPEKGAFGHAKIPFAGTGTDNLIKGPILLPNSDLVRNDDFSIVVDAWANDGTNREFYIAAMTSVDQVLTIHNDPDYILPPANGTPHSQAIISSSVPGRTFGFVHLISAIDPANKRRETLIAIDRCPDEPCSLGGTVDTGVSSLASVFWVINSRESEFLPAGEIDMWPVNSSGFFVEPTEDVQIVWAGVNNGLHDLLGGDNQSTITIPATSQDVIAVGSYITKPEFQNADGDTVSNEGSLGDLSVFSSRGPATGNVGVKPDIVAPGQWIASAHSTKENLLPQFWEANEFFIHLQGTSMAAPHITGVLALMLQKNGQLTPKKVLGPNGLLTGNTQTTSFTGITPNSDWGYGIVDAAVIFAAADFPNGTEPDTTGPVLSTVRVRVNGSSATITWATDEPSTSNVMLSAKGGGGDKRGSNLSFVKSHSVTVSLKSGASYSIRVESADLAGNTSARSGGTVTDESACGCASRDGMTPADALPFALLGMLWLAIRLRVSAAR